MYVIRHMSSTLCILADYAQKWYNYKKSDLFLHSWGFIEHISSKKESSERELGEKLWRFLNTGRSLLPTFRLKPEFTIFEIFQCNEPTFLCALYMDEMTASHAESGSHWPAEVQRGIMRWRWRVEYGYLKSVACRPQANYTDRATASCRRS
jgi:hypothetical protein